ncbi:MAG: S-layer homology domain-containing protein [Oscillospiraceae bacterium]|nr:S-layer homology domain-containing protein [Oscillospiraceae bacterium]
MRSSKYCPKRVVCLLVVVCLAIGLVPSIAATKDELAEPQSAGLPFTDVAGHWARDAIGFMVEQGFMQGTSTTTFAPNLAFSRAMAVTILYRMAGEPAVSFEEVFSDVAPGRWYSDAVIWAHSNGVVQGVGGGRFAPMSNITREQMATILYRFAADQGHDVTLSSSVTLDFPDANRISHWARVEMEWAVYHQFMRGTDAGALNPNGNATRAEAATLLMRFVEHFTHSDELEPLCPELETRIRQDFQIAFNVYHLDKVWIEPYLGTYNGSVALYFGPGPLTIAWSEEVAGHIFFYQSSLRILVWNDGAFYTLSGKSGFDVVLPSAYELGLLTAEDIGHIHFRFELLVNDSRQRSS